MKKFLAVLFVFVMAFTMVVVADPVEIDLSSFTTDELVALRNQLNEEIKARVNPVEGEMIGAGAFVVGTDIKAGVYDLTISCDDVCSVKLFEDRDKMVANDTLLWANPDDGEVVTVNLHDGMVMVIGSCTAIINEQAKPSWAP